MFFLQDGLDSALEVNGNSRNNKKQKSSLSSPTRNKTPSNKESNLQSASTHENLQQQLDKSNARVDREDSIKDDSEESSSCSNTFIKAQPSVDRLQNFQPSPGNMNLPTKHIVLINFKSLCKLH